MHIEINGKVFFCNDPIVLVHSDVKIVTKFFGIAMERLIK